MTGTSTKRWPCPTRRKLCGVLRLCALVPAVWLATDAARPTVAEAQDLMDFFQNIQERALEPQRLHSLLNSPTEGPEFIRAGNPQQPDALSAEDANPFADDPTQRAPTVSEQLPPGRVHGRLPMAGSDAAGKVELTESPGGLITLVVRDASLSRVLSLLAQTRGLNIVAANDIDAMISITLYQVPVEQALTAILAVANYTWVQQNNIILVTSLSEAVPLPADVQGRQIQVFELDFAAASSVAEAVQGFLSPIGNLTITESDPLDNRRTTEMIVVEDLPESLGRVAQYIYQIDRPPRQVLIEAHILQIDLNDTFKHGVNFEALANLAGGEITFLTTGFANPDSQQGFMATIDGTDLDSLVDLLQTTTDSKTLGSPKILVLNEQEARIQVGEQLGFRVTTTTETSTLESVEFLNVGVVLSVTPRITRDNRVLLHVRPEVSSGQINPETGLPEEETTELQTDVMLCDGQGMVIGGLIKEIDSVVQSKVPFLGDVPKLGWIFQRSDTVKDRVEIIVALVPRVQPYAPDYRAFEQGELVSAQVPLFKGPLKRTYRPWDSHMPNFHSNPRPLCESCEAPDERTYWPGDRYLVPIKPLPRQQFKFNGCGPLGTAPAERERQQAPLPAEHQPGEIDWSELEVISDVEHARGVLPASYEYYTR